MSDAANAGSPSGTSNSARAKEVDSVITVSSTPDGNAAVSSSPERATSKDTTTETVTVTTTTSVVVAGSAVTQCPSEQIQTQISVLTSTLSCPASVANAFATSTGKFTDCSKDNSTGKLAGAAIGSAVGAALIAVLVTALLCRRHRKSLRKDPRTHTSRDFDPRTGTRSRKGGVPVLEKERQRPERTSLLVSHLPQPADDDSLRNAVRTLFSQIELHVDNYYARTGRDANADIKSRLAKLDSTKLPRPLNQMLADSKVVSPTLKHCIGRVLISMSVPNANHEATLLPSRLAVIPPRLKTSSVDTRETLVSREAYSQWKSLNAYLFPIGRDEEAYQNDQAQADNDVADILGSTFSPWEIASANRVTMHQNMMGIAKTAADLGLILVSQPSSYEFRWETSVPDCVVISPGFWKTSDENGRPLATAQLLVPQKGT